MTKKIHEFKINEYLSLRLYKNDWDCDDGEIIIYVSGNQFMQCRFLLLNIDVEEISTFEEIESIDEAAERLDASMENEEDAYKFNIPPEVEFWGHCSNLQAWFELDYDTRLLHSNLAFPLLKRLAEAGDLLAKKVFAEEIMKRFENGTERTREFLELEGFLRYLPLDVQLHIALNDDDYNTLMELSEIIFKNRPFPIMEILLDYIDEEGIKIEDKQIIELNLRNFKLHEFPKSILKFKFLKSFSLRNNKLKEMPKDIDKLKNLKELWLEDNELQVLPDSICNLKNLETLWLNTNKLKHLPNNIGNLKELKTLNLRGNQLKNLTLSICKLHKLERLLLFDNSLSELPECFSELKSLKYIDLDRNNFTEYPKILKKMTNLKKIDIDFKIKNLN